jgi:hypothetical protein
MVELDKSWNVTGYVMDHGGANDFVYGSFISNNRFQSSRNVPGTVAQDWVGQVYNNNQSVFFSLRYRVNLDPTKYYLLVANAAVNNPATVGVGYYAYSVSGHTEAFYSNQGWPATGTPISYNYGTNQGLAQAIRPIACSALLTNITPTLYQGGTIACVSLPTGATATWIENIGAPPMESLSGAGVANIDGRVRTGPARNGAYAVWIPNEPSARDFKSFTDHNNFDFGGIVFSGALPAVSNVVTPVFELFVDVVYEYTTISRLLTPLPCRGSPDLFVTSLDIVESNGLVFENDTHSMKISDIVLGTLFPMSNLFPGANGPERVVNSLKAIPDALKMGVSLYAGEYGDAATTATDIFGKTRFSSANSGPQ